MKLTTSSSYVNSIYRKPYDAGIILNSYSGFVYKSDNTTRFYNDSLYVVTNNSVDLYTNIKSDNVLDNIDFKTRCDDISYINSLYLKKIISKSLIIFIEKNLTQQFSDSAELILSIPNFGPPLLTYEPDVSYSDTTINEFTIPVRLGEYHNIFELSPTTGERIEKVLNRPYGIHFDDTRIYGRLITNISITLTVILDSGRRLKITLKPYISEKIQSLTGNM